MSTISWKEGITYCLVYSLTRKKMTGLGGHIKGREEKVAVTEEDRAWHASPRRQCTPLLFTKVSLYVFELLAAVGRASVLIGMFYCSGAAGEVAVRVFRSLPLWELQANRIPCRRFILIFLPLSERSEVERWKVAQPVTKLSTQRLYP